MRKREERQVIRSREVSALLYLALSRYAAEHWWSSPVELTTHDDAHERRNEMCVEKRAGG